MIGHKRFGFDVPLFAITLSLVTIGIFFVFSSSSFMAREKYNQSFHFMAQQILGAMVGLVIVAFLVSVKKSFFLQPAFVYGLLALTIFLLMLCLAMPAMARTNRWVILMGFRFQPSELAKISLILFLATYIESKKDKLNEMKTLAIPLAVLVVSVVLVLLEPDFGTAVLLAALAAMVLFIGGVKLRYLVAAGLLACALFGFYLIKANYRVERLQGFFSQQKDVLGSGYQVDQSKLALGSGGLVGAGLGQSTQKLNFLPFAHTDFIFAILGEETGLLGTFVTLALYLLLLWRGLKIATTAPTPTYKMIAAGLTLAIVVQALMNISIVLGLGPAKGTPLPLLSYGRSSLICTLAAIGLLLHISQKRGDGGNPVKI
ncbi:MAG TPA: FtsW/RodA/SpoVE family cell cycle protein [Candidatus Latescibacteria bacterium]|nr:FtsW/RodA/SpoVE family cell cycle protein [Candidatus Latescibacterota bacterium]